MTAPLTPERYDNWCVATHGHQMMKAAEGMWVLYTELDKMERRAIAAERERDEARAMVERLVEYADLWAQDCLSHGIDVAGYTEARADADDARALLAKQKEAK